MAALATLAYALCNATSPQQTGFALLNSTVQKGGLCVGFQGVTYNAPLALLPCDGSASQAWVLDAASSSLRNPIATCGGLAGACVEWSGQEWEACTSSPPSLGPGCIIGSWPTPPGPSTSWNDRFLVDSPAPGMLQAAALSSSSSGSGLCVAALPVPPPPPLPLPTPELLAWSRQEVMCLYDIDMATYAGGALAQGCQCSSAPPPVDTWAPTALDTDSWLAAGQSAGCQVHILVAKHMCGFVSWASTSSQELGYNYSSAYAASRVDVVAAFVASARKASARVGMYYSLLNNARTNTCAGRVLPNPAPGQLAVTEAQYNGIVMAHLEELYGNYGELEELWFPQAVGFQGQTVMPSATRWIGSESGLAPYPTWSTCDYSGSGAGSPDAPTWFPAETDFTALQGDTWFWSPSTPVRPPQQLRAMYEASVGHNSNALIGIGIPPNCTLAGTAQAAALAGLGAYVAACYGTPALAVAGQGWLYTLLPSAPLQGIDRVVYAEDQALGQRVRAFQLTATFANGTAAVVDRGSSVGNKKVTALSSGVLDGAVLLVLNVTAAADTPHLRSFAIYANCNTL